MKTKTINSILRKKLNDWLDSINDKNVKEAIEKDIIITGGCIVSLLQNEEPNDYDVYFATRETVLKVVKYYVDEFNRIHNYSVNHIGRYEKAYVLDGKDVEAWKNGEKELPEIAPNYSSCFSWEEAQADDIRVSHMITNTPKDRIKIIYPSDGIIAEKTTTNIDEYINACDDLSEMDADSLEKIHPEGEGQKYRPVFLSTNAITLSNKIQIVIRFYGAPGEIHENYDFEHCTCYWIPNTGLHVTSNALMAILNKELFYRGSKYPICSIIRTRKFLKRGWHINAGQYLKMCFQISGLDLNNIDILEDQLVGVDSLYFMSVVRSLRALKQKDKTIKFDSTYLASIIDKIF